MRRFTIPATAFGLVLALGPLASARGLPLSFDHAVAQATWIIEHDVLCPIRPEQALLGLPDKMMRAGVCFLVRVRRCHRGPFETGDVLLVWDPRARDSVCPTGREIAANEPNLSFLQPPSDADPEGCWLGTEICPAIDGLAIGLPIRNQTNGRSPVYGSGLEAWTRLLKLTRGGQLPPSMAACRAIVDEEASNPALVYEALRRWRHWHVSDADRLRRLLIRHEANGAIVALGSALLHAHREAVRDSR